MNSQTKRLTPTSTEGIQGRTPRGRKKGLSAEQRHNAALMRVIGACSNCQRRKEKCDPGTPCRSCLEHYKGDLVNHPCRDRVLSDKSASFLSDKLGWHPSARSLESFVTPNSFNLVPDITYNIPLYFGFGDPLSLPVHALNVDEPQAHLHEHIIYAWPPESSTGSKHTHAALPALLTRDGMSGLMETLDNHLSLLVSHHFRQFPLFCSPLRILREVYIFYLSRPSHYRTLHQALKLLVLVHIGGDITLPPPKDNPVLSQLVQNTNVPNDLTPTPCFIRSQFGRVMPGLALSLMKEVLSSLELLLLNRECDDWPMALAVLITVLMTVESIHYHAAKLPYHNSFDSPEFSTSDENHGIDEEGVNTLLAFYSSCFAGCHARLRPDWEGETKAMSPTQRNSLSPDNLFIESVRGSIKRASDGGIISCKATEKRKGDDMEFFFDRLVARLLLMKPASVFSVQSLASSATDLSKGSIYSANQIVTATRELVDILQGDEALIPFYKSAIEDPSIGPERLQRNLGRLVKQYAENLKSEAKESLEYLAARLVSMKAKFVARSIVQTFAEGSTKHVYEKAQEKKGESSEDDVDEDVFEDIIIFREFLVHSDALKTLRAQVQSFVLPKGAHSSTEQALIEEVCGCEGYSEAPVQQNVRFGPTRGIFSRLGERLNALLVAVGCREPPLEPGRIRLRWQCGCGEQFTSDVTEHRQGGVADLVARMQRSTGARIVATPYNSRSTNQKYKFYSPIKAIGGGFTRLSNAFRKPSKQCTLPRHNNTTTASTTPGTTPPQQKLLHLLSCMHAGRFRKSLYQDRIEDITTDHGLFCFLRKQFIRYRGRFCTLLSLKTVKSLKFIKFRLPRGGSVEVRQHDPSQPLSCCDCLPPPDRVEPALQAEYKCKPGPPDIWPPIDPEYLAHLMISPCYIDKKDDWILDMLPRRICGVLEHNTGQPVEGWGIYFEEDWDRNIITLVVFITFLTTSLVFGILWYKLKMDMQGAFGVCAYMMAACAVIISMVTMWVDRV
ncbi:hypothetical protein GQ44DRAFT_317133 [Phaeosphaeriaceae sp. PMI808]|nr:hypothetical protein GQ44DRAFT_317133 [Phaeosphaeriaceae sp. PMI808]